MRLNGSFIHIAFAANSLSENTLTVPLPEGYSYERIFIHSALNISQLIQYQSVKAGDRITFPPVNCKSPSVIYLHIDDLSIYSEINISIEKFRQIPDEHYFDSNFTPILVTGEDGKEYKVIPSDQFK